MKLIKRLTTSLTATLDSAVGQIENHDAIIDATIKQTKQAVAKTKAQINTLLQQQQAYEAQFKESQNQMDTWEQRAIKLAESDQAKALQCLARRNQCQNNLERLTTLIEQQKSLINDVTINLNKLHMRMDEMSQKHHSMRSRQTVANVNRLIGSVSQDESANDTFERWESIVMEHEMALGDIHAIDPLDAEFSQQESDVELLKQLAELTNGKTQLEV